MMLTLIEYFDIFKEDRIESGRYQQIGRWSKVDAQNISKKLNKNSS